MKLRQALEFSRLSTASSDECTLVPEFGVGKYCVMHDHLLQHLVFFRDALNIAQIRYLQEQRLYGVLLWATSKGKRGSAFSWKDANHLFREGLQYKIQTEGAFYKKVFYWFIRNLYYVGVTARHRIQRFIG